MAPANRSFHWRAAISFTLLFLFLAAIFSGIALYLRPEGSLARWVGWRFLGMDKKTWEAVHTLGVAGCSVIGLLHLLFNFRTLAGYLRRRSGRGMWLECATAVGLSALLILAAVGQWPPFSALQKWRADIRDGRYSVSLPPPQNDAEELSLPQLAPLLKRSPMELTLRLQRAGMVLPAADASLRTIAARNRRTPEQVFRLLVTP